MILSTQAVVERALLDTIVSSMERAWFLLDARLGHGNAKWIVAGALVLLMFWALRRR